MFWKIYDESNSTMVSEGTHPNYTIEYAKFTPDPKTKIIQFDFTKDFDKVGIAMQQSIPVMKG
jgi:hypothetical protein